MAGGMRTGRGLTLAERAALSGVVPDRHGGRPRTGRRHCWVAAGDGAQTGEDGARTAEDGPRTGADGARAGEEPWPGLVLDWQRRDGEWWAYVVYLARRPDARSGPGVVAVQEWVPAARLTPAAQTPG